MFEDLTEDPTNTRFNDYIDHKSLQKLGDWKELFFSLFDVTKELLFILNKDGLIIIINHFGAASLEYSVKELIGKHFSELVNPSSWAVVNASIGFALKNDYSSFEASL